MVESWSLMTHMPGSAAAGAAAVRATAPARAAATPRRVSFNIVSFSGGISGGFVVEHRLDGQVEQAGDLEGERQRRVVLAGLDGVDALAGDPQAISELALAPVALGAQDLEAVLHGLIHGRARPPATRKNTTAAAAARAGRVTGASTTSRPRRAGSRPTA